MTHTVTAIITNLCDNFCPNCIAGCHVPRVDMQTELDIDALVKWLEKFFPDSHLHISGGEPTMLDGIETKIQKCIDAGFVVTVFSNAQHMTDELRALDCNWHFTHHPHKQSESDFVDAIAGMSIDRIIVARRFDTSHQRDIDHDYSDRMQSLGFEIKWIRNHWCYEDEDHTVKSGNPNDLITMVGKHGEVYQCSYGDKHRAPKIGNIYKMTYDPIEDWNCPSGKFENGTCQACQSADMFIKINNRRKNEKIN